MYIFLTARNGHRHTQFYHSSKKRCLIEDQPGLFESIVVLLRNSLSYIVIIYLMFIIC